MALTFGFYLDPAMTTPILSPLQFVQDNQNPAPVDKVVYFGSPNPLRVAKSSSGPDIAPVILTPTGPAAGDVRLALSAAGLNTSTPGAALTLGLAIAGGSAVPLHMRAADTTGTSGRRAMTLTTNTIAEFLA